MFHHGGFLGLGDAIAEKADPFSITSWIAMVKTVEGNDKLMKLLQCAIGLIDNRSRDSEARDSEASLAWRGFAKSLSEGRKSARLLRQVNSISQMFDDLDSPSISTVEKGLVISNCVFMALEEYFDYICHIHRAKFVKFDDRSYHWVSIIPGVTWSLGNICSIILAARLLHVTRYKIARLKEVEPDDKSNINNNNSFDVEKRLRVLHVVQFRCCLDMLKGVADLFQSASMTGVDIQYRFPALFGWLTDTSVDVFGIIASLIGLFNKFPAKSVFEQSSKAANEEDILRQKRKNISSLVFLFLQVGFVIKNSPAFSRQVSNTRKQVSISSK